MPYLFLSKGDNLQFFTNLTNSKLISELVSNDLSVFLCFYAAQLRPILISITICFSHAQMQNSVNEAENTKRNITRTPKRQIGGVSTKRLLGVCEILLSFSKYFLSKIFLQNIKKNVVKRFHFCSVHLIICFTSNRYFSSDANENRTCVVEVSSYSELNTLPTELSERPLIYPGARARCASLSIYLNANLEFDAQIFV